MSRKTGAPVPKALRKKAIRLLKLGNSVASVANECDLQWKTVDTIRRREGIAAKPTGFNGLRTPLEVEALILERLKSPERIGEESIALEFGVSRSVVRRIRQEAGIAPVPHGHNKRPLDSSPETRERVARDDEIHNLREEIKKLHREEIDAEAVKILLGRIKAAPVKPPMWTNEVRKKGGTTAEVPVTIWADWHMGEVVDREQTWGINEFNPEIAERRVKTLVESTIRICRDHHNPNTYPGIVINLLGDTISGAIHPELAKTDAEEQIPSALRCRDILVWAIETIVATFGRVYIPCACGNHGRNTLKPEFKRQVYNSFDWLIYQLLAREFDGRKEIVIDIPVANEAYYRVFGQRYLAMHGDHMGVRGGDGIIGALGPIARGEVKVGKQAAAIGRDFDRLLIGHWHQEITLPRVVVANTLKGFDEYAKDALRAPPSTPSQPLWFVHPNRPQTSYWNIMVEEPVDAAVAEWVSFPKVGR